jgi:ATP synthase subunit C.
LIFVPIFFLGASALAAGENAPVLAHWGYYMAAAVATGVACLGAGYAVAHVGAAAVAAVSEKPEMLGRVLIIVGLAEGIAIYGLIIAFIIIARLG